MRRDNGRAVDRHEEADSTEDAHLTEHRAANRDAECERALPLRKVRPRQAAEDMVATERLNGQDHEHIEQEVQRESNGRADARTDAAEGGDSPGTVDEDIVGQDVYGYRHKRDDHRQARAAMCIDEVAQDTCEEDRHDADGNGKEIPRGDLPDLWLQRQEIQDRRHEEDAEHQEDTGKPQ